MHFKLTKGQTLQAKEQTTQVSLQCYFRQHYRSLPHFYMWISVGTPVKSWQDINSLHHYLYLVRNRLQNHITPTLEHISHTLKQTDVNNKTESYIFSALKCSQSRTTARIASSVGILQWCSFSFWNGNKMMIFLH